MRLTRSFRTPHPNPERKPSAVPARRSPPRRKRAQEAGRRRGSPELARSLAPAAASSVNETARTPGSPRPRPSRALRLRKTQRHPFPVTPDSAPPGKRPPAARGERTSQPLTPPNAARPQRTHLWARPLEGAAPRCRLAAWSLVRSGAAGATADAGPEPLGLGAPPPPDPRTLAGRAAGTRPASPGLRRRAPSARRAGSAQTRERARWGGGERDP